MIESKELLDAAQVKMDKVIAHLTEELAFGPVRMDQKEERSGECSPGDDPVHAGSSWI